MIDGPGSVNTLILVVVRSTEEGGGELLLPEEDKLAGLDVDVTEEDDDCGERVDGGWDKGVGGDDDGDAPECVDGKEDEGAGEARTAAARRTRMAKVHMDVQWGYPMDQLGETGQGWDRKGENCRRKELL
jgi:hypothetical protein